jgi:hypothetical protein
MKKIYFTSCFVLLSDLSFSSHVRSLLVLSRLLVFFKYRDFRRRCVSGAEAFFVLARILAVASVSSQHLRECVPPGSY